MIEERIEESNLDYVGSGFIKNIQNDKKNRKKLKEHIFDEVISLIYQKKTYMLGPEKTKTARFIATHFIDVFELLDNLINKNKKRL
ncbi:MAG: hypothetical protein GF353_20360 [Candidatus Lokiarchaeota archaeon]|nr:hypothetical protein [Candidatus Lokiarchaeota archaeon]